ncbi:MAG: hypothetical protein IPK82_27565 [Polyangiaceae bacterium]|nr:hypothetical protein [Polyangiaceae bacterium]
MTSRSFWGHASVSILAVAALAGGSLGCQGPFVWTGQNENGEAAGMVVSDGDVLVYVCGGDQSFLTLHSWLNGEVISNNSVQVYSEQWDGYGYLDSQSAWFDVSDPQGNFVSFQMDSARDDIDGLYEVFDSGCRTGAVVWTDSAGEAHLQGVWCDEQGNRAQVTPVGPVTLTNEGIQVSIDLTQIGLTGEKTLYVTRAEP